MESEIRRVPPNWQHPIGADGYYIPMRNFTYRQESEKWNAQEQLWQAGRHELQIQHPDLMEKYPSYEDFWGNRPEPSDPGYRPGFQQEPTWYQLYETTTQGTPVSPPFATIEELTQHMIDREYGTPERIQALVDKNCAISLAPSPA